MKSTGMNVQGWACPSDMHAACPIDYSRMLVGDSALASKIQTICRHYGNMQNYLFLACGTASQTGSQGVLHSACSLLL